MKSQFLYGVMSLVLVAGCTDTSPKQGTSYLSPQAAGWNTPKEPRNQFEDRRPAGNKVLSVGNLTVKAPGPAEQVSISGRCVIKQDSNIEVPCPSLKVVLVNAEGQAISSHQTEQGRFSFTSPGKGPYHIRVESERFELSKASHGRIHAGDNVIVEVQSRRQTATKFDLIRDK